MKQLQFNIRKERLATMITTGITALVPTLIALVLSFDFWSGLLQSAWAGATALMLLEGISIFMLILYITRVQHPLLPLRHMQPVLAAMTSGEVLGEYINNLYHILPLTLGLAIPFGLLIGSFVLLSLHAFEQCFVTNTQRLQERQFADEVARREYRQELVDAFKGQLLEAQQVITIAHAATEEKSLVTRQLAAQELIVETKPMTIADFRRLGFSVNKATRAASLARLGLLTPEKLEQIKRE